MGPEASTLELLSLSALTHQQRSKTAVGSPLESRCGNVVPGLTLSIWEQWQTLEGKDSVVVAPVDSTEATGSCAFLSLLTTDVLGWGILSCGGHPLHCRRHSGFPGLHLLDASYTPTQVVISKSSSRHYQISWGGRVVKEREINPGFELLVWGDRSVEWQ